MARDEERPQDLQPNLQLPLPVGATQTTRRCTTQILFTIGLALVTMHVLLTGTPGAKENEKKIAAPHDRKRSGKQRTTKVAEQRAVVAVTKGVNISLRESASREETSVGPAPTSQGMGSTGVVLTRRVVKLGGDISPLPVTLNTTPSAESKPVRSEQEDRTIHKQAEPRERRERVAVCICGTSRTFHHAAVHESIRKNVIMPLQANYTTDVFFIVRTDDDPAPGRQKSPERRNATLSAIQSFNPVVTVEYNKRLEMAEWRMVPRTDRTPVRIRAPKQCNFSPNRRADFSHTLYRTRDCLRQIAKHEKRAHMQYDWVYRTRPDIVFFKPVSLPFDMRKDRLYMVQSRPAYTREFARWWRRDANGTENRGGNAGNGRTGDQVFAAGRAVADIAFRAVEVVNECAFYQAPVRNIESGLRMWLLLKGVRYEARPWLWAIVREKVGPECATMRYLHVPGGSWRQGLALCVAFARRVKALFPGGAFVDKDLAWVASATRRASDWMSD